jgi:predicted glycosyl hydrolase (DUF1957 family)
LKHVGLLLHFYQPPTQDPDLVRLIDSECYLPIFSLLNRTGAPVTVNISYSLTEQLSSLELPSIDILADSGGVEFTGTAAWHPILPMIDRSETARQTAINCQGNRRMIGRNFEPSGYFPPEMAFNRALAEVLGEMGFQWTITDDVPWTWTKKKAPFDWIPSCGAIRVFLRSNFWSNQISFHGGEGRQVARNILAGMTDWCGRDDAYTVLAMDGETFGHHRKGGIESFLEPFLGELMSSGTVCLSTLSHISSLFPSRESDVPPGSWSTTVTDLEAGIPWPLWSHPDNRDHAAMWELLRTVLAASRECSSERVALLADRMLYSCPFWWAGTVRRNREQVRRGVNAVMLTASAIAEHTGKRDFIDRVMSMADKIPIMTGEED